MGKRGQILCAGENTKQHTVGTLEKVEGVWQEKPENVGQEKAEQNVRKQFHPAFYAGMELVLSKWKDDIECHKEYNLNTMPNRIDLLVIKKHRNHEVGDELGAIFRTYNLMEYKSPDEELGIISYDLLMSYVHLYKAYNRVNSEGGFTVSFVRDVRPVKLMKWFKGHGFEITDYADGRENKGT